VAGESQSVETGLILVEKRTLDFSSLTQAMDEAERLLESGIWLNAVVI